LLSIRGLRKHFGGVIAVDGVDLDVWPGQIVGLIGPNGSGKTTVFNLTSGVYLSIPAPGLDGRALAGSRRPASSSAASRGRFKTSDCFPI